jgi:nucleoside-diphosphate-sugar epimerase
MKVLFIGGSGNISTACSRLALERGIELYLFTRGQSPVSFSGRARTIYGDIRNRQQVADALKNHKFDAVVNWVAFEPEHVETDIDLFRGRTQQYIFISSASAYRRPPDQLPITEAAPLSNLFWQYARDKIACEDRLNRAHLDEGFPVTIVRPSHTYGESWIPCAVGGHDYTVIDRMKRGRKIIVHGNGQSLWVMTHNSDFAKGLIGLLGNRNSIGESYHITSDEVLTWDQIYRTMGHAVGVQPDLIHISPEFIKRFDERTGAGLLGEKAFSTVFDNAKIKHAVPGFQATVSFAEGMRRCIEWFESEERRKTVSEAKNEIMDRIIQAYQVAQTGIS